MSIPIPDAPSRTSPGGKAAAGALEAEVSGAPAAIWASSLDGRPVSSSGRILLTHLTDVQGNGTRYADESREVLLCWGDGLLVEKGSARVSLRLEHPGKASVYALDMSGARTARLKSTVRGGCLCFEVSTEKGRFHYEIVRDR